MSDKKSTEISCLDLVEASNGLALCEFSSVELVKACLYQIELYDIHINAFTHINGVKALEEAKKSDLRRRSGTTLSNLDNAVPELLLKSLFFASASALTLICVNALM